MNIDQVPAELVEKLLDVLTKNSEELSALRREIAELKTQVSRGTVSSPFGPLPFVGPLGAPVTIPQQATCQHEYPQVWHSTGPRSCAKCGHPEYNPYTNTGTPIVINTCDSRQTGITNQTTDDLLAELKAISESKPWRA